MRRYFTIFALFLPMLAEAQLPENSNATPKCTNCPLVSGSGVKNFISKWTSSSVLGKSSIFDNGTSVGIGTSTPTAQFTVVLPSAGGIQPVEIHSNFAAGIDTYTHSSTFFRGPILNLFRSEGTQASPSAVLNGDFLGYVQWGGWNGSSYVSTATMQANADENWTSTSNGTHIDFYVVPNGQTQPGAVKALALRNDGTVAMSRTVLVGQVGTLNYTAGDTIMDGCPLKMDINSDDHVLSTTTADTGPGVVVGVANSSVLAGDLVNLITTGGPVTMTATGSCSRGQFVIVDTAINCNVKCTNTYTAGTVIGKASSTETAGGTVSVLIGLR